MVAVAANQGQTVGGFDMQGIIMQGSRYWSRTWMQLLGLPGDDSRMIGALGRLGRMHGFGVWMYRGRRVDSSPSGTSSSYAVSSDERTGAINSNIVNRACITFSSLPRRPRFDYMLVLWVSRAFVPCFAALVDSKPV